MLSRGMYIDVCNCDVFCVVNMYIDHLKFCVVCIYRRRYVCYSECNVVSDECDEPRSSTSPAFMRSSASHPAGPHAWLAFPK